MARTSRPGQVEVLRDILTGVELLVELLGLNPWPGRRARARSRYFVTSSPASNFLSSSLALTRISHQLPAAGADAPYPAVFSRLGVLRVRLSTSPRPSGRKPHWARHLVTLATKPGEICGLIFIQFDLLFSRAANRDDPQRLRLNEINPVFLFIRTTLPLIVLEFHGIEFIP